jgi:hypothetical protein
MVWRMDDRAVAAFARAGALADGMSAETRRRLTQGIDTWLTEGSRA